MASLVCCAVSVKLYGDIDGNFAIKGISAVNKTIGNAYVSDISRMYTFSSFSLGDPLNVADFVGTVKMEILAMAALAGINFIISITTSALICRGCCTCCHSRVSS